MRFRQSPDGHFYLVGPVSGAGIITYQVLKEAGEALLSSGLKIGERVPDRAVYYMRKAGLIYTYETGVTVITGKGRVEWEGEIRSRISQLLSQEGIDVYVPAKAPWGGRDLWGADLEALWSKYGYYGDCFSKSYFNTSQFKKGGDDKIVDCCSGLIWQTGGSPEQVNWYEGVDFVNDLNKKKAGGHDNWRIPTLRELATLLKPQSGDSNPYFSELFQQKTKWCWSCDVFGASSAWRVNFLNTWAEAVPKNESYTFVKAVHGKIKR